MSEDNEEDAAFVRAAMQADVDDLDKEIVRLRTLLAERDHEIEKLKALVTQIEQDKLDARDQQKAQPVYTPYEIAEIEGYQSVISQQPQRQAMWIEGFDRLKDAPGKPVGFNCRKCGVRVKGLRHVDPRLLCFDCLAMPADRA